ncbi:MAG: hypothetical protein GC190_15450 [Alphaproteobacteria bacterium]|nr:hypothetical protein [Alphaproteobacteria bacterium]
MLEVQFCAGAAARGVLLVDEARMRALTNLSPTCIRITHKNDLHHSEDDLVRGAYAQAYGATIACSYPQLMSVYGNGDALLATIGFRAASAEPLFLERYLNEPIEIALGEHLGRPIERDAIVEIGSLASYGRGASLFLFVALAAYLQQQGYAYAAVTATEGLRKTFDFFGFDSVELADADPSVLPDGGSSWGSYYDRRPKVIAGAIEPSARRVERFLPPEHNRSLGILFANFNTPESART